MLMKEIIAAYDVLDSSFVTGEEVKKYLDWRANGFKFHYVSINSFSINCSINSTFLL